MKCVLIVGMIDFLLLLPRVKICGMAQLLFTRPTGRISGEAVAFGCRPRSVAGNSMDHRDGSRRLIVCRTWCWFVGIPTPHPDGLRKRARVSCRELFSNKKSFCLSRSGAYGLRNDV